MFVHDDALDDAMFMGRGAGELPTASAVTGDIIDTYVYRMGLVDLQYSNGTAVGLFKSIISFVLLVVTYKLADKYAGYRVF